MSKITASARNEECQVKLACCNYDNETTVAAHIKSEGCGEMGGKPHDFFIAYACSVCHDEIDRRTRRYDSDYVRSESLEGMRRTQEILIRKGLI